MASKYGDVTSIKQYKKDYCTTALILQDILVIFDIEMPYAVMHFLFENFQKRFASRSCVVQTAKIEISTMGGIAFL